jgi:hypothetical protein
MDAVAAACPDITKKERAIFNFCRLYLRVTRISDLSTADGTRIRQHLWIGEKKDTGALPTGWWPKQPRPSTKAWTIWKNILLRTFRTNQTGTFQIKFPKTGPSDNWIWYLDTNTDRIYQKTPGNWYEYSVLLGSRNTRNRTYGHQRRCDPPDDTLTPITVYPTRGGFAIDGKGINTAQPTLRPKDWTDSITFNVEGDMETIRLAVILGRDIFIVSDGSAKDGLAASAWVISSNSLLSEGSYIYGRAKVPGTTSDSHRAECFGILGGLYHITQLSLQWNINLRDINITFGCDNVSALEYSFRPDYHVGAGSPDFDILQSTRCFLTVHGLHHVSWRHVKGHQTGTNLDCWAKLNNLADKFAGMEREDNESSWPPQDVPLPHEKWQIHGNDGKIIKDLPQMLHDHCSRKAVSDTWHRYKRVDSNFFDTVDWTAMAQAMKEATIQERHWISKRAARDCGSNYVRMKRKEKLTDDCPFCGQSETVVHVMKCQSIEQQQVWSHEIFEFSKWLEKYPTDPTIIHSLIQGLEHWRASLSEEIDYNHGDLLIAQQVNIGWNGVLEGCFGLHWRLHQSAYLHQCKSRRSGHRWMVATIRRIWKIPWELWKSRNDKEHSKDVEVARAQLQEAVNKEIEVGDQGIPELLQWFTDDELLRVQPVLDRAYAQAWLRNVKSARRRDELRKGSVSELSRMRTIMRNYLSVPAPPQRD